MAGQGFAHIKKHDRDRFLELSSKGGRHTGKKGFSSMPKEQHMEIVRKAIDARKRKKDERLAKIQEDLAKEQSS